MPDPVAATPNAGETTLYTALRESTEAWVRSEGRIEALDRRVSTLEATLDERMAGMDLRMGTMCSHLDNISRESARTAELLASEQADRREREKAEREAHSAREKAEAEARSEWRRIATKVLAELWAVFKVPVGGLVTAAAAYMAWSHYEIPATPTPVQVHEVGDASTP